MNLSMDYEEWGERIDALLDGDTTFKNKRGFTEAANAITETSANLSKNGEEIRNYRGLLLDHESNSPFQEIFQQPVYIKCKHNHDNQVSMKFFDVYVGALRGEAQCLHCRRNKTKALNIRHGDARLKLSLTYDERGERMDMDTFTNSSTPCVVNSNTGGYKYTGTGGNIESSYRKYTPLTGRQVKIATDGEYAFVYTDPLDADFVRNPFLKDLLAKNPVEYYFDEDDRNSKGCMSATGIKLAIIELLSDGAKVVNVCYNPSYQMPGRYTWGDITKNAALAEFISTLEDEWLDWQAKSV